MFFVLIGQTRQLVPYGLSSSVNWNAHQTLKVWMMMQFTHDNIHIQWIGLPFNGVGSKLYSSNSTLNGMKEFVLAFSKMCDSLITFYHYMHVSCRYGFEENMQDTWKTSHLRIHRRPYFYRRLITHMALLDLDKQTSTPRPRQTNKHNLWEYFEWNAVARPWWFVPCEFQGFSLWNPVMI